MAMIWGMMTGCRAWLVHMAGRMSLLVLAMGLLPLSQSSGAVAADANFSSAVAVWRVASSGTIVPHKDHKHALGATKTATITALLQELQEAPDVETAKTIEQDIRRLWLQSGSDSIDLLMQWVQNALQRQDTGHAMDLLDTIIAVRPDFAEAWNQRATIHYALKDYGKSLAEIRMVLQLEPRHFKALGGLGLILRDLGEEQKALAAFRKSLALHPYQVDIREAAAALEEKLKGKDI